MTDGELDELLQDCPTLHHLAEPGAWSSIRRHGLLSTSALLDLYGVEGAERQALEGRRRPDGVMLRRSGLEGVVIRDQKPMDDAGLSRALQGEMVPEDWYRLLNGKVFFWLTRARMERLRQARPYRGLAFDLLELDTAALVTAWRPHVRLSAINSGATKPFAAPRGADTFLPIESYPYAAWRRRRGRGERVVELVVEHSVPDVERFVRRVTRLCDGTDGTVLFEA